MCVVTDDQTFSVCVFPQAAVTEEGDRGERGSSERDKEEETVGKRGGTFSHKASRQTNVSLPFYPFIALCNIFCECLNSLHTAIWIQTLMYN